MTLPKNQKNTPSTLTSPFSSQHLAANPSACATGAVEVIVGSMFSGKSEELIRLLRRAQFAKQPLQVFKPRIDSRYSVDHVTSHDRSKFPSIQIDRAVEIYLHLLPETKVIGIDEGQFFDDELVDVVDELADRGIRVLIAGLDMDWKGEPFAPMPALMAIADTVMKLRAVCVICGSAASRTQRLVNNTDSILVGESEAYEARCRSCFDPELAIDVRLGRDGTAERDLEVAEYLESGRVPEEASL